MGVLSEIVGRIDEHALTRNPYCHSMFGGSGDLGNDIVEDSGYCCSVVDAERPGARHGAAGVRADDAGTELRSDLGQCRIVPGPGVVDDVGSGRARQLGDRGAPSVHADALVGILRADPLDEGHHASNLLGRVDEDPRSGLDPADVDDVGPLGDDPVYRGHGGLVGERRAPVVEGVGSAVDDRHDEGAVAGHRSPAERRVHPAKASWGGGRRRRRPGRTRRTADSPRRGRPARTADRTRRCRRPGCVTRPCGF